jgi:ketosteroid isomerase-like protein
MSRENLELVRTAAAALGRGDVEAYLACCTDDVELTTVTAGVDGAHQGADGVRRLFSDTRENVSDFRLDLEELEALGPDRVVGSLRLAGTGRASGVPMDIRIVNVWELAGGKIRRVRAFPNREEALSAVAGDSAVDR